MTRLTRITIASLYVLAAAWVAFAVQWVFRESTYRVFYGVAGVGFAFCLVVLAVALTRGYRWAKWVTLCFLGANILLTIADQVGLADYIYLVPSVVVFGLMVGVVVRGRSAEASAIRKNNHNERS
jgi:hypothetical protein